MQTSYSIEINAAPEQVFHWFETPERTLQWVPNLVENETLNETEGKVGTTFRHVYLENGRRMEMQGTVTAWAPGRRLTSELHGQAFDLHVDYRFEDLGGRTRLTQVSDIRMKGVLKLVMMIMSPFMKKAAQAQYGKALGKLKELAERSKE